MMDWTYCKDEMPPEGDIVLLSMTYPDCSFPWIGEGQYYEGHWYDEHDLPYPKTLIIFAWQEWPYPAPLPEEEI